MCANSLTFKVLRKATFLSSLSQTPPYLNGFPAPTLSSTPGTLLSSLAAPGFLSYSSSWNGKPSQDKTKSCLHRTQGAFPRRQCKGEEWEEDDNAHLGAISPSPVSAMCHRAHPLEDWGKATGPNRHRVSGQDTRLIIGKHQVIRNQAV